LTDKDGHWAKKVLYRFNRYGKGGFWPTGGLVLDPAGNLYGTTRGGGVNGGETLFELTPTADGTWKHTVIHTFPSGRKDGYGIGGPPILDSVGNLYCSTGDGGAYGYGTVVRLTPKGGGRWKESILHSFTSHGKAGSNPTENVTFDSAGNLYGATEFGGAYGNGTVYELTPNGDGSWKEKALHSFNYESGYPAVCCLRSDSVGNLYGLALYDGPHGGGTVFELSPNRDGSWTAKLLHAFYYFDGSKGYYPGDLIFDSSGDLYGVASGGVVTACDGGCGVVFKLTPKGNGEWKESVVHSFIDKPGDGPLGIVFDAAGNLYGTTAGNLGTTYGSVFEIFP
jgi:uncharacterized repeat protein (TIGR03803 family)